MKTETEPSMQTLSRFAITAAFTLTCFTVPVAMAGGVVEGLATTGNSGGAAPGLGAVGDPVRAVVSGGTRATATPPAVEFPPTPSDSAAPSATSEKGVAERANREPVGSGSAACVTCNASSLGKSGWGPGTVRAEEVKSLQDEFKQAQRDAVERYREQVKSLRDVPSAERSRVRELIQQEFQQIREELIERQKVLREEIKRRFEEFKREHPEHQELIDDAKERLKEKVRDRRGYEFE